MRKFISTHVEVEEFPRFMESIDGKVIKWQIHPMNNTSPLLLALFVEYIPKPSKDELNMLEILKK